MTAESTDMSKHNSFIMCEKTEIGKSDAYTSYTYTSDKYKIHFTSIKKIKVKLKHLQGHQLKQRLITEGILWLFVVILHLGSASCYHSLKS